MPYGRKRYLNSRIFLILAITVFSSACDASADCPDQFDCPSQTVRISIEHDVVLRREILTDFFSFNLNHYRFEQDLMRRSGEIDPGVVRNLRELPDVYYRYPGGLVSNSFHWEASTGLVGDRSPQASVDHAAPAAVRFGLDEYFGFLEATAGKPWYVLNLLGWSAERPNVERPRVEITSSNARLAKHIADRYSSNYPMYFQLGNELDRAIYQWPVEKYVERSRETIDAIRNELPNARFVAFLRDFDWTYKGKNDPRSGTKSTYKEFIPAVLDGLPDVDAFSLHFYYDDPGQNRHTKRIGWRLRQIESAIDVARTARNGSVPDLWVTEHARGINLDMGKGMQRAALTSNLAATVSTADFLIGISQLPEVKGAFWHGINAGPWQLFDASIEHRDLRPRPLYWGYRVLRSVMLPETLLTETGPQPGAQYSDGYDVRATSFRSNDQETLGLWVANRRTEAVTLEIRYTPFAEHEVSVRQFEVYGPAGKDPDHAGLAPETVLSPQSLQSAFDTAGNLKVVVKASSVTALEIRR